MISLTNIQLHRGKKLLLDQADLTIHPGQRTGITGVNGCGKSSLFSLLLGEILPDSGDFSIPQNWRISHMAQECVASSRSALDYVLDGDSEFRKTELAIEKASGEGDEERLVVEYERMDDINGFNAHYRAEQLLQGLGFHQSEIKRPLKSFSGGWRSRLNLAQALMRPSDLLMLDEPTNHLDLDAILWLENWLQGYSGALLIISHDRDFMDNVVQKILHVEGSKLVSYKGNYSAFESARAERISLQRANYVKQEKRKKEIEAFVARFRYKASKARQAQSRIKELNRMQDIAAAHLNSPFYFRFPAPKKAFSSLININKAAIGYGKHKVLSNVTFELKSGSRVGLLGPNGAGKTTLIKALTGKLDLISGELAWGNGLTIGYFGQHQIEELDLQTSPLQHLQRSAPDASDQEIRNFLGGFNFHNESVLEPILEFSGGEKTRLALASLVWKNPNLLLLDEPTNHLDLEMRHALAIALQSFEGALVLISHDRHLMRSTIDNFYLVAEGHVSEFDGNLADYQNYLKDVSNKSNKNNETKLKIPANKKVARKEAAERRKSFAPLFKKIRFLESEIEKKNDILSGIEFQLTDPSIYESDEKDKLKKLLADQAQTKLAMSDLESEWLETQEIIEKKGNPLGKNG